MNPNRDATLPGGHERFVLRAIAARGASCRAIVEARSLDEIGRQVTRCLVEAGYLVAVITRGVDESKGLTVAASAGLDGIELEEPLDFRHTVPADARSCSMDPFVEKDLVEADERGALVSLAHQVGGEAVGGFWIQRGVGSIGLLSVVAAEPDAFSDEEVAQLQGLAIDLAAGYRALGPRRPSAAAPFSGLTSGSGTVRAPSARAMRQTDRALREQLEMIRSITDSATDAILMVDDSGQISYWNRAAQQIFGWTADEAIGMKLRDLLAPTQHQETAVSILDTFFESGKGTAVGESLEVEALRKDGTGFPVELSLSSVRFRGKWQATGILRDITERQKYLDDLRAAMQAAEAAAEAKSMFLANVSHEIRTPLNGIIGMTDLLLDTPLSHQQRDFARIVKRSGEILLSVINDILDFSKMDAEALQFESIVFSIRSCVEDIGDLLAQKAAGKGLELVILTDHQIPRHVQGDPGRLRQILTNLVNNAIKFTEDGEVTVTVRPAEIDDQRVGLEFVVEDTGIGIPSDRIDELFKPFTQADASTTRHYGGTGLGLSIASTLVERMGGKLDVKSVEGEGAAFQFTAYFEPAHLEDVETPFRHGSLDDLDVLVVDDNATNRRLLEELLGRWGCRTVLAANGSEAIDYLFGEEKASHLDLAILDFSMPGMDGATLASTIKSSPGLAKLPLILLTSMPELGDLERMQKAGFAAYLTKPVKASFLYDAILSVLAGTAQATTEEPARIVTRHTLSEARRSRLRILVAEDNIINQKVVTRMLERLGLRCDLAQNGQEAIDALENRRYDVVLMDCQMPVVDGFEATRQIRLREGKDRRTWIIAATAEVLAGDRERCLEAGMDGYISKPIIFTELAEALAPFIGTSPGVDDTLDGVVESSQVDLSRIREIGRGDVGFQKHLITLFLGETKTWREDILAALQKEDFDALRAAAHSLKGGAENIGAKGVADSAARLQTAAEEGDIEMSLEIRDWLFREMDHADEQLRGYVRGIETGDAV